MLLTEGRRKWLTGGLLALGVLITRLPFIAQYLYEFDSVDFAIATFRFDLAQFTPHPPGYILHILLGRLLTSVTGDINLAFIWLAILLSVGSVLFLWRAAAHLGGERVGVIVAVLWIFAPMFWFFGEVATSYIHEAFFASVILYLGIRLLRDPRHGNLLSGLAAAFSLSIAARQSSVLFFGPAILYLLWVIRPQRAVLLRACIVFLVITCAWFAVLLYESGGMASYAAALSKENLYKTQSVIFGNPLAEHLGVLTKFLLYLLIGSLPVLAILLYGLVVFRTDFLTFFKSCFASRPARFAIVVLLPAFLFYSLIYFMKAGYLLNILPSVYLAGALMLDQIAILHARRTRLAHPGEILLTRRLITQNTVVFVTVLAVAEIVWFTFPSSGKDFVEYADLFSHQTFRSSMESRYSGQESKLAFAINRAFAYSSAKGAAMIDSIHGTVLDIIKRESGDPSRTVILDTWWQRFSYFYFPESICYDIRSYEADTLFSCLRMKDYTLYPVSEVELLPEGTQEVLILMREEHPDLQLLKKQVHLIKLEAPRHMDIYKVQDTSFSLQWKNVRFVRR